MQHDTETGEIFLLEWSFEKEKLEKQLKEYQEEYHQDYSIESTYHHTS